MAYNNPELPDFENEYEYENEVANYQVEINLGPVQVGNITEVGPPGILQGEIQVEIDTFFVDRNGELQRLILLPGDGVYGSSLNPNQFYGMPQHNTGLLLSINTFIPIINLPVSNRIRNIPSAGHWIYFPSIKRVLWYLDDNQRAVGIRPLDNIEYQYVPDFAEGHVDFLHNLLLLE